MWRKIKKADNEYLNHRRPVNYVWRWLNGSRAGFFIFVAWLDHSSL